MPAHVDIKGFCTWEDRRTQGISKPAATTLVTKLMNLLGDDLKPHVGDAQIKGQRGHQVRVPIADGHAALVADIWRDVLADDANHYNGIKLWAQAQRSPLAQKKYSITGKVTDWAKSKVPQSHTVRTFWSPDFAIYAESGDTAVLIATISKHGPE